MRKQWVIGMLVCGAASLALSGPVATNLTLVAAVDLALRDNAELKSLRAKGEAIQERSAQAGVLPNPMFTYSGMDMASGGTWPDTSEKRFMVQQEFPGVGKRGIREGLAVKDAEVMQRDIEATTRDVVLRVKESYYDLYAVQQVIAITRDEEEIVRQLVKTVETLYATGGRAQVDAIKARTEITLLKQKLLEAQAQESTLTAKLNTLFNRRADEPLGLTVTPPDVGFNGSAESLIALSETNRPEVLGAQAQLERYQLEKTLMTKESVPDYKLGLEYRDVGTSDDLVMFSVSVDLPLRRAKNRSGVREAGRMEASGEAARDAVKRQVAFEAREAYSRLTTAQRTLELYRTELVPQAEARFQASESGYRTGKVDFMDLLESERFRLDAKRMTALAEGAVGMQAARLEWAVGAPMSAGGAAGGKGQ